MEEGERARFGSGWGWVQLEKSQSAWRFSCGDTYESLPAVLLRRNHLLDLAQALAAELGMELIDPPV